jgi:hypothetical protein
MATKRITLDDDLAARLPEAKTVHAMLRRLADCPPPVLRRLAEAEESGCRALLRMAADVLNHSVGTEWARLHASGLGAAINDLLGDLECPQFEAIAAPCGAVPWDEVWSEINPPETLIFHEHSYDRQRGMSFPLRWQVTGGRFRTSVRLDGCWIGTYARRDAWRAFQDGRPLDDLTADPIPKVTNLLSPERVLDGGRAFVRVTTKATRPPLRKIREFLSVNGLDDLVREKPRLKAGAVWLHEGVHRLILKAVAMRPRNALNGFLARKIREMLASEAAR